MNIELSKRDEKAVQLYKEYTDLLKRMRRLIHMEKNTFNPDVVDRVRKMAGDAVLEAFPKRKT